MALQEKLLAFMAEINASIPEYDRLMREQVADLQAEFADKPRLEEGDMAPLFALPSATGETVSLEERLASGPVILNFYRGNWCPYCNMELRAYQAMLEDFIAAGASLIAISPQSPDDSLTTAQKEGLAFDVLSDAGSRVAEQYGIAFELGGSLRKFHEKGGYELPKFNAAGDWRLPLAATFVIGSDGRIKLAHIDVDYRKRLEPAKALAALATA